MLKHFACRVPLEGFVSLHIPMAEVAVTQIHPSPHRTPFGQAVLQMLEMGQPRLGGLERLDHDVEVAAAGQAQLLGFLGGDAVLKELRLLGGEFAPGELLQEVVLDAAPGQGA